jgi:uncharacterized protein YdaU (DUF1376 family)
MKRPWFPFYATDWLTDRRVRDLSREARSCYIDLLCEIWNEGPIKDDYQYAARLLHEDPRHLRPIWLALRPLLFEVAPGLVSQKRLEDERANAIEKTRKARKSAEERWRPDAIALQTQSEGNANAIANAEESHSDRNARARVSQSQSQSHKRERDALRAQALELFAEFNRARMGAIPGAQELEPTGANLKGILERLKDGASVESIRHVIAACADETKRGNDPKHFNAATPFRPDNFARNVVKKIKGTSSNGANGQLPLTAAQRIAAREAAEAAEGVR